MKPTKILFLFLAINLGLLGMVVFFPEGGIQINQNLTLTFPTLADLTQTDVPAAADISAIVAAHYVAESPDELYTLPDSTQVQPATRQVVAFEHPDVFNNPLYPLFEKLTASPSGDQPIHILHFGDSQIEADRITGEFRNRMQNQFGGGGVGLVPVNETSHARICVYRDASTNWTRHEVYGKKDRRVPHQKYGVMGYIHHFTPFTAPDSADLETGWVQIKANPKYYAHAGQFEQVKLLYRNQGHPARLDLTAGTDTLISRDLGPAKALQTATLPLAQTGESFQLHLTDRDSLEVYGISLESRAGVVVDNISWRGSSGVEFSKMEKTHLKAQLEALNTGMIIYEFGVNVVPWVVDDYAWYQAKVTQELKILRELMPDTPILVVSVSDMAWKEKGSFVSYPNVELIRDAQRAAALEANCSFWDLHAAMGGKNSMVSWVEASPSLAQKDYTHFNARGAKVVGEMLFDALMEDYTQYKTLTSL